MTVYPPLSRVRLQRAEARLNELLQEMIGLNEEIQAIHKEQKQHIHHPQAGFLCGAEAGRGYSTDSVTCPDCLQLRKETK